MGNAIERFVGRERDEVGRVARETMEGTLRALMSSLTPEEITRDPEALVPRLKADVQGDFDNLGLRLELVRVGEVSDTQGYLASLAEAAAKVDEAT